MPIKLAFWSDNTGIEMAVHHVPGHSNEDADALSRMNVEIEYPKVFSLSDRTRLPLSELWMDSPSPSLVPMETKIPWKLPIP